MTLFISFLLFIFGTLVASFVGVVAGRLHTGQSFISGRSRCDACTAPLGALALVPLLSFVAAKGRAQCCGAKISAMSPATELLLGGLFALSYITLGASPVLPLFLISLSLMLLLVLYDLAHQILPPVPLGLFILSAFAVALVRAPSLAVFTHSLVLPLILSGGIALIHFISQGRAMGFSDAPFVLACALLVGPAALTGLVFSFWIGAIVGIGILARRPRGSRLGVEVPFAPFLAAGFLLAYFTQWNLFIFIVATR